MVSRRGTSIPTVCRKGRYGLGEFRIDETVIIGQMPESPWRHAIPQSIWLRRPALASLSAGDAMRRVTTAASLRRPDSLTPASTPRSPRDRSLLDRKRPALFPL